MKNIAWTCLNINIYGNEGIFYYHLHQRMSIQLFFTVWVLDICPVILAGCYSDCYSENYPPLEINREFDWTLAAFEC